MKPLSIGITVLLSCVCGTLPLAGQQNYVPSSLTKSTAQNPTDMYLEALRLVTQAHELEKKHDYIGAIRLVQQAEDKFAILARTHPDYQRNLLQRRREINRENLNNWQKLAQEQAATQPLPQPKEPVIENEGSINIRPNKPTPPKQPNKKPQPTIQLPPGYEGVEFTGKEGDPLINHIPPPISSEAVESNYERMRKQLDKLSVENRALVRALKRTKKDQEDAVTKLALAAAGESYYRDELVKIKKQMESERHTNNKLLQTLTKRIEDLEKNLQTLQQEKAHHLALIAELRKQNDEQQKQLDALTAQKDALQKERDQLATLVELNSPEKTKNLLDRNLTLTAQLKAAQDKIAQLESANSDSEEQRKLNLKTLEETRGEVVGLKLKLMALQDENTGYRKRITELNAKLINADIELSKLESKPREDNPLLKAENELLRSTIAKQLRILAVQEQSRELLVNSYKRLRLEDPEMAKIAALMDNEERIKLTPAEEQIVNAIAKENAVKAKLNDEQKNKIDLMAKALNDERTKATELAKELEALRQAKASGDKDKKKALDEAQLAVEEKNRQVEDLKNELENMKARFAEQANLEAIANNTMTAEQKKAMEDKLSSTTFKQLEVDALGQGASDAFAKKRFAAAEQLYLTLLDMQPNHVPALVNLGTILLQRNKVEPAIAHLKKATEIDAKSAPAWFMIGVAQYRAGLDRQAAESLNKTLDLDPANATALLFLGNLETSAGQYDKAIAHFENALKITPDSADTHFNMAWTYSRMGKLNNARKSYDEAIRHGGLPDAELELAINGATTLPQQPVSKDHESIAISNPDSIPVGPNEISAAQAENPDATLPAPPVAVTQQPTRTQTKTKSAPLAQPKPTSDRAKTKHATESDKKAAEQTKPEPKTDAKKATEKEEKAPEKSRKHRFRIG